MGHCEGVAWSLRRTRLAQYRLMSPATLGVGAECRGRLGARGIRTVAQRDEQVLISGTRKFTEMHSNGADHQQMLPLW